jgi:chromosome segregation ATPase
MGMFIVEAQEEESLYLQQLQKYDKLWSNYNQQQEAKKQIEYDITSYQHSRYTLIKKIRELEGKRLSFKNKRDLLQDETVKLQGHLKEYELESVKLNQEYWRTQENYGQYQEKLTTLSGKQEQAVGQIKKMEKTIKELDGKLSLLEESSHQLEEEAEEIKKQIRLKEEKLKALSTQKTRGR